QQLSTQRYRITILDRDQERCEVLAKQFSDATVVHASANRRAILEEEGTGTADYFVACTGNDETNIMSGVEARELGAERVMCVVGTPDYANVVAKLGIDHVVSERDVMARQILGYMHEGAVISRRRLPDTALAVYELEVQKRSLVAGKTLAELPFAGSCLVAAIGRDGYVMVPKANDSMQPNDNVVALIDDADAERCLSFFH
ncbi:MAG: NAD-binding protein, partial [Planctomycetota bacterium]